MSKTGFSPKMLVAMLAVCGVIAGLAAWLTGLNFLVLYAICVVAVLLNGVVATIEDRRNRE